MTAAEATAQAELREIVVELDHVRGRLGDLRARLPVSPEETAMLMGEAEMDFATEVRSVIECVLSDLIQPAIRDLTVAASHQPRHRPQGPPEDATPVDGIRLTRKNPSEPKE